MKMHRTPNRFRDFLYPGLAVLLLAVGAAAQKTATPATAEVVTQTQAKPRTINRRLASGPNRVVVAAQSQPVAPQVVTVVHQLSAIKMLRLMLRQGGEKDVVAMMSEPLAMTSDVHTNIIAGLVLDDGQTIAVWLPQAAAEVESPFGFPPLQGQLFDLPRPVATTTASAPNLSVVLSDGRRLNVNYVGLDGTTGVSVLRAKDAGDAVRKTEANDGLVEGQRLRLLAPQRAAAPANIPAGTIYVRVGETDGKLGRLKRTSAGKLERLTAISVSLSPAFVGGVALDESGATVGIVEGVEGNQARILPMTLVRAAVTRVLGRQASVPRPLLGVRGEPVAFTSRAFFLSQGWPEQDLNKVFERRTGILLTSVLPGTPAARANLHTGDVIVRVNEDEVKTEEDFSAFLSEAGSGTDVRFTVLRPTHPTPESIVVKLGGSLEPFSDSHYFTFPVFPPLAQGPLTRMGIETFALSPRVASSFGAQVGLLVVGVQAESAGARAGVREGDIIESVDGRPARSGSFFPPQQERKKHALTLVRDRQRREIAVELSAQEEP